MIIIIIVIANVGVRVLRLLEEQLRDLLLLLQHLSLDCQPLLHQQLLLMLALIEGELGRLRRRGTLRVLLLLPLQLLLVLQLLLLENLLQGQVLNCLL